MRKMTLMQVAELHKRYENRTTAIFAPDGYVSGAGIEKGLAVDFEDGECPELGARVLVMVETLPDLGKRNVNAATGDPYQDYLEKRKAELSSPQAAKPLIASGRKFR